MLSMNRRSPDPGAEVDGDSSGGRESGLTLVELAVAMTVSMIILTITVSMISIYAKAEAVTVRNADEAAFVRLALLQFQNDVQSATSLPTLSQPSDYDNTLKLVLPSGSTITWQYTQVGTGGTLTRQVGSATPVVEVNGVTNGNALPIPIPVFDYYDHCNVNQVTEPQATPSSISSGTTVVQITLSVQNLSSAPYGTTTKANIMNRPPGANRCG
jgi:hypothetical protein